MSQKLFSFYRGNISLYTIMTKTVSLPRLVLSVILLFVTFSFKVMINEDMKYTAIFISNFSINF